MSAITNLLLIFKNGPRLVEGRLPIRVVNDGTNTPEERLGSVGDIRFVWQKETSLQDWLVIGGDNLFDQNLSVFMDFAMRQTPAVTIGVFDIKDIAAATKFGVLGLDKNQKVTSFQEKPKNPVSSIIAMCVYYFPKADTWVFRGIFKPIQSGGCGGQLYPMVV